MYFFFGSHRALTASGSIVLFLWLPSKEKATKKKDHRTGPVYYGFFNLLSSVLCHPSSVFRY